MQLAAVELPAAPTAARTVARSDTLIAAIMEALLGVFLIWGVGFSPIAAVHNAAHDTRHSISFPCH
jgi:cobalt transporter subunit CbtB